MHSGAAEMAKSTSVTEHTLAVEHTSAHQTTVKRTIIDSRDNKNHWIFAKSSHLMKIP